MVITDTLAPGELGSELSIEVGSRNSVVELYHVVATTREVDTAAQATNTEQNAEDYNDNSNNTPSGLSLAHEVELNVLHEFLGETSGECHTVEPATC